MKKYNKYKALKAKLDIVYKDIRFNRVLALHIWNFANRLNRYELKHLAYYFLSLNLRGFKTCDANRTILSTYGMYPKKDHQGLYYGIIDKLEKKIIINNLLHFRRKIVFHPQIIVYFIRQVFARLKGNEFSTFEKFIIAANFVYYANTLSEIERIELQHVGKYLAFCDMMDVENLMTQYIKKRKIKTLALQHGAYRVFKIDPPIDCVQVDNIETDCLLCWGQYTIDEDVEYGISRDRLTVAGYPKQVKTGQMKENNQYNKGLVLLARHTFHHTNVEVINILRKHSAQYSFSLKLHPSCNIEIYKKLVCQANIEIIPMEKTVQESLNNDLFDFAIAVNTTAYYEALMQGIPCLRFADGTFDLEYGYDDVFEDKNGFLNKISLLRNKNAVDYQNDIDSILQYAIGMGIDNYRDIILNN